MAYPLGGDWRGDVASLRALRELDPHQPGAAMLALLAAAWTPAEASTLTKLIRDCDSRSRPH